MANQTNTRVKVPKISSPGADTDLPKSIDDGVPLNPTGRGKPDGRDCKRRGLAICKRAFTISTMNVRTIRENRCREELVSNLIKYNIDMIGIQEHRIVHDDTVKYETILGRTLITTSAIRNKQGAAVGGVGILLNNRALRSLASIKPHSDRTLIVNFQGNPATTVVITYCPTNVADEDIVEEHYNILRGAINSIPAHNLLLVVGDFNARIGKEDGTFTFHNDTNRNGEYMTDLAIEKDLMITK